MRFRKPSLKSAIGLTKAKRRIKKAAGIYTVTRVTRTPVNIKRKALSRVNYYSLPLKVFRLLGRLFKRKD